MNTITHATMLIITWPSEPNYYLILGFLDFAVALQRSGRMWCSTTSESDSDECLDDNDNPKDNPKENAFDEEVDDFLGKQPDLQLQGVNPKRGWNFRGVHKVFNTQNLFIPCYN